MLGALHETIILRRRFARLVGALDALLPERGDILDVGAGGGEISAALARKAPGRRMSGIDTVARPRTAIPVSLYDGRRIPFPDASFDGVLLVDVLHHTHDVGAVLAEVCRVCRGRIVIKDHLCESALDRRTLELMDWAGNARFGVSLDCRYLSKAEWRRTFDEAGLAERAWREKLDLYVPPLDWLFGRGLHFVAALEPVR